MDKTYLPDLISELEQELLRLNYTKGNMTFYHRHRNQLMTCTEDRDECYYTEQLGMDFLKEFFGITQEGLSRTLPQAETQEIRVVCMVGDFQLHHTMLRRYLKHKELLTTPLFVDIRSRFQSSCEEKGCSQVTTEYYVKQSSYLMDYLAARGVDDFTAVTLGTVNAYTRTLAGFSYKTVEQHICSLHTFFHFPDQKGIMPDDPAVKMPMVEVRKQAAIPSVWTQEELKQLVRATDRGSPKDRCDYVITLIACHLGLRCTDTRNLCFKNFNWAEEKLCFTQSKTEQLMELPSVPDVGWVVIDYLKYGRLKVDSGRVFVRHAVPFFPFTEGDHLGQLVRAYVARAHIPICGKHRGMHSLCHTMVNILLEKDTPLPVISDIIRHLDMNSTAIYLKVDMERLVGCPLDFEEVIHLG